MQLKFNLLMAGLAVLGLVIAVAGSPMCMPPGNGHTCINMLTASPVSPTKPIPAAFTKPNQGVVTIYSPSCIAWGEQTLTTNDATYILAVGLSFKNPVLFVPIYNPTHRYATPKWEYAGKVYGYQNCDYQPDPEGVGYDFVCAFGCVPFELDSKVAMEVNGTALGGFGE